MHNYREGIALDKTVNGVRVAYTDRGEGLPVFLLHGWGASGALFSGAAEVIAQKYRAICMDFPGFGASPEPPDAWDVSAYAALTRDFIASFGYDRVILLGHSFGGRVILKMMDLITPPVGFADTPLPEQGVPVTGGFCASSSIDRSRTQTPPGTGLSGSERGDVAERQGGDFTAEKIILTGCAGIRHEPSAEARKRTQRFKAYKKLLGASPKALDALQKKFGSADYAAASPLMRQVLVKTVNEDLRDCMSALTMPTLLLWGEDDPVTPLADGREMERLIPGAGLAVIPGAGHFAFLDRPGHFNAVVKSFLNI